jgi:hypothetical protein
MIPNNKGNGKTEIIELSNNGGKAWSTLVIYTKRASNIMSGSL